MDLSSKLRKAASLFVELPPEPEAPTPPTAPATHEGVSPEMSDIDRRLAAMNQNLSSMNAAPAPVQTQSPRTVEQIVRDADGPNLDQINVPSSAPPPVLTGDGRVDFSALYQQAGLPPTPFTAEQTLDMLTSLPQQLPLETRRQTVQVTLGALGKTIGATSETIVADASRKLAALAAYSESVAKDTADFLAAAEFEIAALQAQIEEKRGGIMAAREKQAQVAQLCATEADRLDDVLEFFSLDSGASRYAAVPSDSTLPPPLPPSS